MAKQQRGLRPADYIYRAAFARAIHEVRHPHNVSPEAFARAQWSEDDVTPILLRATSSAATLGNAAWAGSLAHTVVGDFIASLVPISAGARLLEAAPRVSLDGVAQV